MSKYTIQVKEICESFNNNTSSVSSTIEATIEKALPHIFNFDYPFFNIEQKIRLERQFLRHNYFKEIGFETYGVWNAYLCSTLRDIMPYYIQLYKTVELKFDPFNDTQLSRNITNTKENNSTTNNDTLINKTENSNNEKTSNENTTANNNLTSAKSETPQGSLDNVKNLKYLSEAEINNSEIKQNIDIKSSDKNNLTNNEDRKLTEIQKTDGKEITTETLSGKQSSQSYSSLLLEYRTTLINIDLQIIEELNDLFMKIY